MSKKLVVDPSLLAKAHVSAFTRKDGAFVKEHDDKRQAAKPKAVGGAGGASGSADKDVKSNNTDWGFHGEAHNAHLRQKLGSEWSYSQAKDSDLTEAHAAAAKKFSGAANQLVQAGHFDSHDKARDYLDSTHGRHLHDALSQFGDISKVPWLGKDVKNHKAKSGGMQKSMPAAGVDLLKSQIQAYTRKDGAFVAAHDDKRQSAEVKSPEADLNHPAYSKWVQLSDGNTGRPADIEDPYEAGRALIQANPGWSAEDHKSLAIAHKKKAAEVSAMQGGMSPKEWKRTGHEKWQTTHRRVSNGHAEAYRMMKPK